MEDKLLIYKFNQGSESALCRIYEKYRDSLLRIAAGLVNDISKAEDIVQDVFLTLIHSRNKYKIKTNLKAYLTTAVVNKARNSHRSKLTQNSVSLDDVTETASNAKLPEQTAICNEEFQNLYNVIAKLPYEQKETVILRIQGKMKFRQIAKLQEVSVKTTLSRYNYGLTKLRSILKSEAKK